MAYVPKNDKSHFGDYNKNEIPPTGETHQAVIGSAR